MQTDTTNHRLLAGTGVEIRLVRPGDGATLKALRLEAITTCTTAFASTVDETHAKDWDERAAMCDGTGDQAIFVADHAGQLVGMTGVWRATRPKQMHACSIWGVYVAPAFRRKRVGEALVRAATEWAEGLPGVSVVRLMVVVDNDDAVRCYERCGYTLSGKEIASIDVEGREYDEYLMFRRLDPG